MGITGFGIGRCNFIVDSIVVDAFYRYQIVEYRLSGVDGIFFRGQVDQRQLLEGIGQRIEQRPLLAHIFGDVGAGQAKLVHPRIYQKDDYIFGVDITILGAQ